MKIANINNNINFKHYERNVFNEARLLYRSNTYMFRNDFNWGQFPSLMDSFYKNVDKVTFIDHACSVGHEAFTIVAKFINDLGQKAEKFFPILAKDFDEESIEIAKQGKIDLGSDASKMEVFLRNPKEMFDITSGDGEFYALAKDHIRNKVNFEYGDIMKDIEDMPSSNTILFCRNFWPYLSETKQKNLAKALAEKFKDGSSFVVIGNFDREVSNTENLLEACGFQETNIQNVFQR